MGAGCPGPCYIYLEWSICWGPHRAAGMAKRAKHKLCHAQPLCPFRARNWVPAEGGDIPLLIISKGYL